MRRGAISKYSDLSKVGRRAPRCVMVRSSAFHHITPETFDGCVKITSGDRFPFRIGHNALAQIIVRALCALGLQCATIRVVPAIFGSRADFSVDMQSGTRGSGKSASSAGVIMSTLNFGSTSTHVFMQ